MTLSLLKVIGQLYGKMSPSLGLPNVSPWFDLDHAFLVRVSHRNAINASYEETHWFVQSGDLTFDHLINLYLPGFTILNLPFPHL